MLSGAFSPHRSDLHDHLLYPQSLHGDLHTHTQTHTRLCKYNKCFTTAVVLQALNTLES
jgi:hypothetical protein